MNPMLKKVLAAVAVKEAIEKVQEMRRPKPTLWSRISPLAFVAAIGGALFYLNKTGKLGPVVDQVKGKASGGSSNGSGSNGSAGSATWSGGGSSSTAPPAPSPSTV